MPLIAVLNILFRCQFALILMAIGRAGGSDAACRVDPNNAGCGQAAKEEVPLR